jgi:hypothetical protein
VHPPLLRGWGLEARRLSAPAVEFGGSANACKTRFAIALES